HPRIPTPSLHDALPISRIGARGPSRFAPLFAGGEWIRTFVPVRQAKLTRSCRASMTKAVTAAAAMQLVEQGKLSLDAPIASVLPDRKSTRLNSSHQIIS